MSSNDQQHPYGQYGQYGQHGQDGQYGQDPAHGYGYDQADGRQPQPAQPYGQQAHGAQSYGAQAYGEQSYGAQAYGEQYGEQSYGQQVHGAQPYGQQAHGDPSHGAQAQAYGQQASHPDPYQAPHGTYDPHQVPGAGPAPAWPTEPGQEPAAGAAHGPQDPAVAQTWEGRTWDTHYQPVVQSAQPVRQPGPDAARTGSPQPSAGASGSYPLPPEVPVAPVVDDRSAQGAALDDTGYGPPSTLGNSRVTDAQRARAEGRSPIIAPGMQPAGITAALGLLLAVGAAIGSYALFVPLVLLQAVTAAGWFRLNGMWPARQGIALAFAGGLVADIALLAAGRENGPAAALGTLGVWVLLTVVLQLRSRASADERMQGLMATVASAALSVLAAGHLAAVPDAVTVGAVAVAVAVLVRALPLPGPASVVVAMLAATGAGAAAGTLTDLGAQGALLGFAAGGCALIGLRVASYDYPSRFVHMTAGVALPLTAAAPAVYLIGRLLG